MVTWHNTIGCHPLCPPARSEIRSGNAIIKVYQGLKDMPGTIEEDMAQLYRLSPAVST
jgi:hypothetical protein